MALFRRRRDADLSPEQDDATTDDAVQDDAVQDAADGGPADDVAAGATADQPRAAIEVDRSAGPWDVAEQPEQEGYLDLGALRLPAVEGVEIRLDVEEQSGSVTAATVLMAGSVVQLQAFAAPRSEGIWDEIRSEIKTSVDGQGGTADEVPGVFGYELLAKIPARTADGRTTTQAARFAGVDGPRWFLRAVFHGPAAYDAAAAEPLEQLVRSVVVVRGGEAMAPRELLPLRLPQAVEEAAAAAAQEAGEGGNRYPIDPFERGPEITEVR